MILPPFCSPTDRLNGNLILPFTAKTPKHQSCLSACLPACPPKPKPVTCRYSGWTVASVSLVPPQRDSLGDAHHQSCIKSIHHLCQTPRSWSACGANNNHHQPCTLLLPHTRTPSQHLTTSPFPYFCLTVRKLAERSVPTPRSLH